MSQQTIIAYFETRTAAENARDALVDEGVAASSIRLLPEEGSASSYKRAATETSYDYKKDEGGFWASLGDFFMPDDDRSAYAEGMSRGGATLSVTADEADYDHVSDILEQYGSVDLDERETEWKREGWSGYSAGATPAAATGLDVTSTVSTASTSPAAGMTGSADRSFAAGATAGDDETIKVVEEQLRVGKRQVDKGRVRVRSYVVETPVQEQVSLHSERVFLERRPVDRALTGNEAAFTDRVIEAEERREEAVVSKEARVVEEIGLRREAEERTETVSDTVRKTQVEIDDERLEGERLTGTKPLDR